MSETNSINLNELTDKQQRIVRASYDVDEKTRANIAQKANVDESYVSKVLTEYRPEFYQQYISDPRKSNGKAKTNGHSDNHVPAEEKRHTESVYPITMTFSEFEARMIGNRLWELGLVYEDRDNTHLESELKWWSRRFMAEVKSRENNENE